MLCQVCQGILRDRKALIKEKGLLWREGLIGDPGYQYTTIYHPTGASWQNSAREGCHICFRTWAELLPVQQAVLLRTDFRDDLRFNVVQGNDCLYIFFVHNPSYSSLGQRLSLPRFTLQLVPVSEFTLDAGAADTTASNKSLTLAVEWINDCLSNHSKCNSIRSLVQWYPTRLIDVGASSTDYPRLIITAEEQLNYSYVTLSHCWGSAEFLQLKSHNLDDFKAGIRLSSLPRTFQEAILFTRRLGIRYIWIDSLCIIQNSKEDWLKEANLMEQVYSQSYCSLAATAATDAEQGLFRQRDVSSLHPADIEIPWFNQRYQLVDEYFWRKRVLEQPLNQRAWALQERLLAPRVLHFSSEQILWECCEMYAAETYPRGIPPHIKTGQDISLKTLGFHPSQLENGSLDTLDETEALILWRRIIEIYSASLLTRPGDKLIALSGLARRQKALTNDDYVAGLWRTNLPPQLLWTVRDCKQFNGQPSVRPVNYRAPSFSWAAVDGRISHFDLSHKQKHLIDIVEVQIISTANDPFGPVEGGFLRVRGLLGKLQLRRDGPFKYSAINSGVWLLSDWRIYIDVDEGEYPRTVYRIAISSDGVSVSSLILEETGSVKGHFRRIGLVENSILGIGSCLDLEHHEDESQLPCEIYDPITKRHTIRIL